MILSNDRFEYMVKVSGAEHIIRALNYPYVSLKECSADFLMNADLTGEETELVAHGNAERILHLN